jgi:hypothetical protein
MMPRKQRRLAQAVETFLVEAESEFTIDDVVAAVDAVSPDLWPDSGQHADIVDDILDDRDEYFFPNFDDHSETYIPRNAFFHGARFRVVLTRYERENRIFIPGHRFIPFCGPGISAAQAVLTIDGEIVPPKKLTCRVEDLIIYHSLLNPGGTAEALMAETELDGLAEDALAPDANVDITVFDLAGVFEQFSPAEGDTFVLTVESWRDGKFAVEYSAVADRANDFNAARRWCETLEQKLIDDFDEIGPLSTVAEQLAVALYEGPEFLRREPAMHFGGFLSWSKKVRIIGDSMRTFLWHVDGDPPKLFDFIDENFEKRGEDEGELEHLMQDLGLTVNEAEYEAFMRDELFSRGDSLEDVIDRIFVGRATRFPDPEQEATFNELSATLWDEIKRGYDREQDAVSGPLRQQVLEVFEEQMKWIRRLDRIHVSLDELPQESFLAFSQITSITNALLTLLNDPDDEELTSDQVDEITEAMSMTRELVREMQERMDQEIREMRQDKWKKV